MKRKLAFRRRQLRVANRPCKRGKQRPRVAKLGVDLPVCTMRKRAPFGVGRNGKIGEVCFVISRSGLPDLRRRHRRVTRPHQITQVISARHNRRNNRGPRDFPAIDSTFDRQTIGRARLRRILDPWITKIDDPRLTGGARKPTGDQMGRGHGGSSNRWHPPDLSPSVRGRRAQPTATIQSKRPYRENRRINAPYGDTALDVDEMPSVQRWCRPGFCASSFASTIE